MQRRSPARASRRDDDEHERSRPTTSRRGTSGRAGDARIVRWAVVGIGHIAQVAVLPAFRNARANSRLVALISGDGEKLARIGRRYRVEHVGSYDDFEHVAAAAGADAVYIALPNHLHAEYTERAAAAGLHVLCEKPMAVTTQECRRMIDAAERHGTKLMTAYRLHFEAANLQAIESVVGGKLGETRQIHAVFSMVVRDDDNVRLLPHEQGGGPVYDLGVYCINAARYLFRAEPDAVTAIAHRAGRGGKPAVSGDDVDTVAVMLSFPGERVMTFTTSFAAAPVAEVRVVGSKGDLRIENAFEYVSPIRHWVTVKGRTRKTTFRKRDQFAPELLYFAGCVLQDRRPEPSGIEGLADVRVIEAIYRSIAAGKTIQLSPFTKERRPDMSQEIRRPPVKKPREIHAQSPSEE